ncbi:MAG: class I SAM-dependent DNA methyltransferase, partial [Comamonadaceae bacterium CG17_big_fil_post_rev_8_21_14_2_50_60_13]
MATVFAGVSDKFKNLDYVASWTIKGAQFAKSVGAHCAFVTTNSICQGEQVALLWPLVFRLGIEIGFACQSFKWRNNAAANAGVTCVVVGIRPLSNAKKMIFADDLVRVVKHVSPYLIEFDDTVVEKRAKPLSNIPPIDFGSMPNDNGCLLLGREEREKLLASNPASRDLIRKLTGSQEFIKGVERWCLWIDDEKLPLASSIPEIAKRIDDCREHRMNSGREATNALAQTPYRFGEVRHEDTEAIVAPLHFSEDRPYLTLGLVDGSQCVISNSASAVFNPPGYLFAIMSSRLHLVWTASVGGQLETRLRYSNTLVYNTFPIPELSSNQKATLESHSVDILSAREAHPGKTIAWLYD